MDLPITLVIKAPNQRVEDQTVDCMLGWTVKKLKQHLTDVYPNKPQETHQKLIYSGKLLADHMTLKEVLRQFEDGSNKHTVHLVCSSSDLRQQESQANQQSQSHSRQSSCSSSNSTSPAQSGSDTEGLRYRGPPSATQTTTPTVPSPPSHNMYNPYSAYMPSMGQMPPGFAPEAAMFGGMTPDAGMVYSPEQYMWMQQMYSQYMAQYMQYYQQAGYPVPQNIPTTPTQPQPPNQADNNQQERVGAADDDVDEEFQQRDWLDYIYTFSRFMVLLGIVYFYSSMTRFLMVGAFFLVVYAYQMGWLAIRNVARRNQQHQQQQPEGQQQQQQQQEQPQDRPSENNAETDSPDAANNPDAPPTPAPVPQGPSPTRVIWTFVSTFFTSLFPAPPPAVNVN